MAQNTFDFYWSVNSSSDGLTLEIREDGTRSVTMTGVEGRLQLFSEELRLDSAGRMISYSKFKNELFHPIREEKFWRHEGKDHWENLLGPGSAEAAGDSFYFTGLGSWEPTAALVRFARNRPGGEVKILPRGRARVKAVDELLLANGEKEVRLKLYALELLAMQPLYLWLDGSGELFAALDEGGHLIREDWREGVSVLSAQQSQVERARLQGLTHSLTEELPREYVIENAHFVDVAQGLVQEGQRVVVRNGQVSMVGNRLPEDFTGEVLDASGLWLAPGLWDMHGHFSDRQGIEALASGITTVRDMGSQTAELLELMQVFESGEILGPTLIPSGFLDGPCSNPPCDLGPSVDSAEAGEALIEQYSELGFPQIKLYASVNKRWIKSLARAAHDRGLRVTGHIPPRSSVSKVIGAGYDEVTHISSLIRDLAPVVQRYRGVFKADYVRRFDPKRRKVNRLLEKLVETNTVLDPTLTIYHDFLLHRPGHVFPAFGPVQERLPPYDLFRFSVGAMALDEQLAEQAVLNASALRGLLALAHEKGVVIVAGSDGGAGYYYLRELELFVEAGLSPAQVLRIASLGSAEIMGMEATRGSVAAGKAADLLLLEANPLEDISALRKVRRVIKGQRAWRPARLREALNLEPSSEN